ncbi:Retrovirus-related Pol polyprotein from transposon TNT 1-94 [Linum perenne]
MTSGKAVTLTSVLHVHEIRKNLVSTSLLVKHEFKVVFVSDKVVISKNDMFVRKGYLCDGLFKLSVMNINKNDASSSSYLLESPTLWHARLGHVNYKSLRKMMNMEILPKSQYIKSTSGYVFTVGGGAISWKSSKQTCIARSTMESEFIALDKAGKEAEWLQNFLEDILFWPKPLSPISIHCDSQAAIGRAESVMYNGKSRHIRRRHNTVRQLISSGVISIDYVKSKDNVSDPLTKGLSRDVVEKSSRGMGLWPRT